VITDKELKRVLRVWLKRMKLQHWQFTLGDEEPSAPTDEAEVVMCANYDAATLRLRDSWRDWDADTLNEVILHELVHCTLKDFQFAAMSVSDKLGAEAKEMYLGRLTHELEHTTDTLTMIMLKSFGNA
jgi:hypothetical protein